MQANALILAGRLTADPELKHGQNSGKPFCKFSIAVGRSRDADAPTDFFDCTVFGKHAERIGKWGKKGALVLVSGRLQQDRWESDGQKRSKVVVIADTARLGDVPDGFMQQPATGGGNGGQHSDGYGNTGGSSGYTTREVAAAGGGGFLADDKTPF